MTYRHAFCFPHQAGMIRTNKDEYFIEPLERGKQMEEEKGRIHMVYRRSAVAQHPTDMLPDVHREGTVPLCACLQVYSRQKEAVLMELFEKKVFKCFAEICHQSYRQFLCPRAVHMCIHVEQNLAMRCPVQEMLQNVCFFFPLLKRRTKFVLI